MDESGLSSGIYAALARCVALRERYYSLSLQRESTRRAGEGGGAAPPAWPLYSIGEDGVYVAYANAEDEAGHLPLVAVPTLGEYYQDCDAISATINDGPTKTLAFRRLRLLLANFQIHLMTNEQREANEQKAVPHRDFYNVRKVDTHVHHSSSMNCKHLLRFIKRKLKENGEDVVITRQGSQLTLAQVFHSLNLTAYDLSIDVFNMHAHKDSFHRFDRFNMKYNPIGEGRLREIFLKTNNLIKGKYLAELTRELIGELEETRYQMVEWRLSIYGHSPDEWDALSSWVVDNDLVSDNVRWLIQIPRLYDQFKEKGTVGSFQDMLVNIFGPLFRVARDPQSNPKLAAFLERVVGFDCVDDESKREQRLHRKYPFPQYWESLANPPYSYYLYYLYANIASLNHFRRHMHPAAAEPFRPFVFRPHCGEAGDPDHLVSAFLLAHGINHGITLRKVPALQYLYYLCQVGIAMSPLSNNILFLAYDRNPFHSYFQCGMNVSLSTDDPLQFHYTKEPLIEEYSVAAQICKLSSADMCEIARNSVLQSGFEVCIKEKWLGRTFDVEGPRGNDMNKTNVPHLRVEHRYRMLMEERQLLLLDGDVVNRTVSSTPISKAEHVLLQEAEEDPTDLLSDTKS